MSGGICGVMVAERERDGHQLFSLMLVSGTSVRLHIVNRTRLIPASTSAEAGPACHSRREV